MQGTSGARRPANVATLSARRSSSRRPTCGGVVAEQAPVRGDVGGTAAPAAVARRAAAAGAAAQSEEVTVSARRSYVEAGSGPVVVLLHGLGGNGLSWAFTAPALSQKYRVIVPDQLGHGRSDKPFINYRIATYVDFLDKFLDELKVERASLVGNSMGGWIAAAYALQHPARVERSCSRTLPDLSRRTGTRHVLRPHPSTREGCAARPARPSTTSRCSRATRHRPDARAAHRGGRRPHIRSLGESITRGEDISTGGSEPLKAPTLHRLGREGRPDAARARGRTIQAARFRRAVRRLRNCGHFRRSSARRISTPLS